ncbi:Alkylhydroperoxidase family enzyme, contains CxxC motif [Actinacidiphila rubida]|uniref:Alkylhydroperoxidase family enzyme, contains CxxC motif n=2 Tax=Actinacidiphila rubida TaxID=310780 RepID=A0A1H8ULN2_9ACTN|nr:Alkylhydroperoxidase family enzyme, contains CxxC motif [Actinacidiphila rubida]
MGSRMGNPLAQVPELAEAGGALLKALGNGAVAPVTINLVNLRAGQIAGSTYATVRFTTALRESGESDARIAAVATWWDGDAFTESERAALALTEAVFQPGGADERVSDDVYADAVKHYDAKGMATLSAVIGQAAYSLAFALIGKPVPGVPMAEQWT